MERERNKVVIVGGGVAALEAALALKELAPGLVEVELVAPEHNFVYRPLLVAEPFGAVQVRTFPLHRLAESAGAGFTEAIVTGVDSDRHIVRAAAGDELSLRAEAGARGSMIDTEPLWWPPAKIVGRYLAPFLAAHLGLSKILPDAARGSALSVEVELTPSRHGAWSKL